MVWVLMIVHSCGSSLPGLLMISFGIAILPTSWSSAPNSRLRGCRRRGRARADRDREPDDALAVLARVVVVGLDHVAEHERGALVGVLQLEQSLESRMPLAREGGEHAEQGEQPQHRERLVMHLERDGQRDGGERRVDPVDPGLARLLAQAGAGLDRVTGGGEGEVDRELGEQRQRQHSRAGPPRLRAEGREHGRGADGEPRVADCLYEPARHGPPAQHVRQASENECERHEHRRERDGHDEQQRDEGELGRDGESGRHVEPDARRHCQHQHAHQRGRDVEVVRGLGQDQSGRRREHGENRQRLRRALTVGQHPGVARERLREQGLFSDGRLEQHLKP